MRFFDLQMFADSETSGVPQNVSARSYQLEFKELLQAVFETQSYFDDFFGGELEALDGVQDNQNAFYVKTSDIPVVVGEYNTDANKAFGDGTATSSRFGSRTEVIYTTTEVPYTWRWAFHEGIDRHTVNNDFDAAIADRLELQARAKTAQFNKKQGEFISNTAAKNNMFELSAYDDDSVLELFNKLSAYYNNIEAVGTKIAKVNSSLYNAIVNHSLTTTGKSSVVSIDDNEVIKFKGFEIDEVPDGYFTDGDCAYVYIAGVGKAFTGINTARTIESEDFDGVALQGAGKAGEYILPVNKKAVVKVTVSAEAEGGSGDV